LGEINTLLNILKSFAFRLDIMISFRKFTKLSSENTISEYAKPINMKGNNNIKYQEKDLKLARFAKALGHPARIAILRHLSSLKSCCFTEIADDLPLAYSTVSEHLTELKNAGLIQGSIEPPRVQYCINYENWELVKKYLNEFTSMKIAKNKTNK